MNPLPQVLPFENLPVIDLQRKIVFCITRDIHEDDMNILKSYAKVLKYEHDLHNNLNPESLDCEYLVLDLRLSPDRYFLTKQILSQRAKYSIIVYKYAFEYDVLDDYDNDFSSFPKKQALKMDYENLLKMKRVKKANCFISLATCVFRFWKETKN